jgi:hypothetical protein
MNAQDQLIASLSQRLDTLEAALQAVMQKLNTKPRATKELTPEDAEAKRLKINEASRISKMKQRAKAAGFDDIAAYQAHMATKRNKLVGLLVQAADETPAEAVPSSRTVVEFDDILSDEPTPAEASQERNDETDNLPSEAGTQPDVAADPTPAEPVTAKNRKKK